MPELSPIQRALLFINEARARPSVRLLNAIYGSAAKTLRARVATMLTGRPIPPSGKEAQYGRLRTALMVAVGADGNCTAAQDADFEEKAEVILAAAFTLSA